MSLKDIKIYSFARLINRGFGRYKLQILALAILGLIGGFLEGVGVNSIIPLFSFVMGTGQYGTDIISRAIQGFFSVLGIDFRFRYVLIFVSVLFVVRAIALFLCNYIRVKISAVYEQQTRNELFKKTAEASWPYLLEQKLGHLQTLLMVNVDYSAMLFEYLGSAIMMASGLIMYILVAINISLPITLITLLLGAFILFIFKPLVARTKKIAREKERFNKQVAHYLNENVVGMKTIKTMSVGDQVMQNGYRYFEKLRDLFVRSSLLRIITDSFIQPIGMVFVVAIFAISYKTSNFNFAALAAIIYLIQRIFTYVQQLQSNLHTVSEAVPYLAAILEYSDEAEDHKETDVGKDFFEFNRDLKFKNVGFSYDGSKPILLDLDFSIKKGEMVGLVGASGAGKTTVVDLILRLFKPSTGQILLDGKNIGAIKMDEWRKNIGYVSQDIFLKNDTIANNIKFYDEAMDNKKIEEVAKMANIYDFIQDCPNKFSTVIGERGILLSAGQRQRIVIARVLAREPKILILDEATSALDNESEVQIQKVIEGLKGKITVLAVAHRLSTIINSDRLLVLDDGKIIEQGPPQKMLQDKQSYFYKVYNIREN